MVTASDEAELARQMERAEAENAEVAGDSAEEDEDQGTELTVLYIVPNQELSDITNMPYIVTVGY